MIKVATLESGDHIRTFTANEGARLKHWTPQDTINGNLCTFYVFTDPVLMSVSQQLQQNPRNNL